MSIRRLFLQQAQAVANTDFIIEVKTDNAGTSLDTQFTIPTTTGTYLYDVTTSDGQSINGNTGNLTITFPSAGTYDINISGLFPQIYFNNGGDKLKLIGIKNWGNNPWASMSRAFYGCRSLVSVSATDIPDLSSVPSVAFIFRDILANPDITNWDVSSVTNFRDAFNNADGFDRSFANWDINQGTNFTFFCASMALSTANYDATLISWAAQAPNPNEATSFGSSKYTLGGAAETAKNTLINTYGWTIIDGGGI